MAIWSNGTPRLVVPNPEYPIYRATRLTNSERENFLVTKVTKNPILRSQFTDSQLLLQETPQMKSLVWLATLSLLVLAIYCGSTAPLHQTAQAAVLTEGSFPTPEMHKGSPEQLAAARGEGSYPTPCWPGRPCKQDEKKPVLQAGEGSYPTPCWPGRPCKLAEKKPVLQAGEGSYPTPCWPGRPCKQAIALLGDGSAPAPYDMPGGMN
jgi:hypothetical protein